VSADPDVGVSLTARCPDFSGKSDDPQPAIVKMTKPSNTPRALKLLDILTS
jgi:hypothetical protein